MFSATPRVDLRNGRVMVVGYNFVGQDWALKEISKMDIY
jgi:hypothetical protein